MHEPLPSALEQTLHRDTRRLHDDPRSMRTRQKITEHRQRPLCLLDCALRLELLLQVIVFVNLSRDARLYWR